MNIASRLFASMTGAALILVGLSAPPAAAVSTLQTLLNDACSVSGSGTVQVPSAIGPSEEVVDVPSGQPCTIDLNGFTVSSYALRIGAGASLTVIDTTGGGALESSPLNSVSPGIEVAGTFAILSGRVWTSTYSSSDYPGMDIKTTGRLTVSGGTLAVYANTTGPGILNSSLEEDGLAVSGGTLIVKGASGISGSGDVLISGGDVQATADQTRDGAAIGCQAGLSCEDQDIEITGGTVTATGGYGGAGIGGGKESSGAVSVEISGGTVTATGNGAGAGIGTGWLDNADVSVKITGGTVTATGTGEAAGIGAGKDAADAGSLMIAGNAKVTATAATGATASGPFGKAGRSKPALSVEGAALFTVNGPLVIRDLGARPQARTNGASRIDGTGTIGGGGWVYRKATISKANDPLNPVSFISSKAKKPSSPSIKASAGDGQVTLTFKKPKNGGADITNFEYSLNDGKTWVTPDPAVTASPLTIAGLSNGTSYRIRVRAVNVVGSSGKSNRVTATPAGTPLAPADVTVKTGDRSLTVSWRAPSANGSTISSYTITAASGTERRSVTASASKRSATITKLTNGKAYTVTVTAKNGRGTSTASTEVEAAPVGPPGVPSAVTVTPAAGGLDVSWAAPAGNGGQAITGYTATAKAGKATFRCQSAGLTCSIAGLNPRKSYAVTVTATNGVATSAASKSVKGTPMAV